MNRLRLIVGVLFAAALSPLASQAQTPEDLATEELRRIEDELSKALVERDADARTAMAR